MVVDESKLCSRSSGSVPSFCRSYQITESMKPVPSSMNIRSSKVCGLGFLVHTCSVGGPAHFSTPQGFVSDKLFNCNQVFQEIEVSGGLG